MINVKKKERKKEKRVDRRDIFARSFSFLWAETTFESLEGSHDICSMSPRFIINSLQPKVFPRWRRCRSHVAAHVAAAI